MGSLRNPIGPLPSSIYWRRRAVGLALLVSLIVLVLWAVNVLGQGGEADTGADDRADAHPGEGPARSITPGPTDDESATISGRPGGREEASDGPDEGGGEADGDGSSRGGSTLAARSGLPRCAGEGVSLTLRSAEDSYEHGERPRITLTVRNGGSEACAVDFGPTATVVSIADVDDTTVWASDHCPSDREAMLSRAPAGGEASHTLSWNRERSAVGCATPTAGAVRAGTYLVTAELPGGLTARTSFVLAHG